ncbi:hypothetical protein YPPY52_3618, partial [Yersinia pestis PY-52]
KTKDRDNNNIDGEKIKTSKLKKNQMILPKTFAL